MFLVWYLVILSEKSNESFVTDHVRCHLPGWSVSSQVGMRRNIWQCWFKIMFTHMSSTGIRQEKTQWVS